MKVLDHIPSSRINEALKCKTLGALTIIGYVLCQGREATAGVTTKMHITHEPSSKFYGRGL